LRAIHFVIDQARADDLRERWLRADQRVPLDLVDCPDRRIEHAAGDLVIREASQPGTHVTVVLPRRSYAPLLGRLMHDRTADKIARVTSRVPRSAATIIPFDVTARLAVPVDREAPRVAGDGSRPRSGALPADGMVPAPGRRGRTEVAGHVHTVEIRPVGQSSILACTITAAEGELTALFYGRTNIPGLSPGSNVRLRGPVSTSKTGTVMINPAYELTD
jgi:hypothetical protein